MITRNIVKTAEHVNRVRRINHLIKKASVMRMIKSARGFSCLGNNRYDNGYYDGYDDVYQGYDSYNSGEIGPEYWVDQWKESSKDRYNRNFEVSVDKTMQDLKNQYSSGQNIIFNNAITTPENIQANFADYSADPNVDRLDADKVTEAYENLRYRYPELPEDPSGWWGKTWRFGDWDTNYRVGEYTNAINEYNKSHPMAPIDIQKEFIPVVK